MGLFSNYMKFMCMEKNVKINSLKNISKKMKWL
jgi:hypothetical protein